MDFELTEEQQLIRESARQFAEARFRDNAEKWDAESIFPRDELREAAEMGFAAIYVNEESGGSGFGRLDAAIIFEELAAACSSTAAYISIHNMASWMIDRFGNDEQRAQFLPKLVTMDHFASYCLTEPGAGSDAASLKTRAVRDGDHYVLNGSKAFISGGGSSDVYVVMVRTGEDGPKGISTLVIERIRPAFPLARRRKRWAGNHSPPPPSCLTTAGCRSPTGWARKGAASGSP